MASSDAPKMVAVDVIVENSWNPNKMDDAMHAATIENIRRFGFNGAVVVRPVTDPSVDAKFEIVDGAHRYRAAKELGLKAIPVVVREFTDAEAKAQTIAMNQLRGEMAPEDLARLVREIDEDGIGREDLLSFSGFTSDDLDALDASWGDPAPDATGSSSQGDGDGSGAQDQSSQLTDQYVVVVTCADEQSQLALADRLDSEGFNTRLVIG